MNKRGQFYLIIAIILVVVVAGFAVLTNYSRREPTTLLNNLKEELEIESERVFDYITITDDDRLDEFMQNYSDYAKQEDIQIYFIFGDSLLRRARIYEDVNDVFFLDQELVYNASAGYSEAEKASPVELSLTLNDITYDFAFNQAGANFNFLLSQEINGEKHVVTN